MSILTQSQLNAHCLENPKPGDYWGRIFDIKFIVLKVLDNDNLVVAPAESFHDGTRFQLSHAYELTREEFKNYVEPTGKVPGVCAHDVVTGRNQALHVVKIWEIGGSRWLPCPFGGWVKTIKALRSKNLMDDFLHDTTIESEQIHLAETCGYHAIRSNHAEYAERLLEAYRSSERKRLIEENLNRLEELVPDGVSAEIVKTVKELLANSPEA